MSDLAEDAGWIVEGHTYSEPRCPAICLSVYLHGKSWKPGLSSSRLKRKLKPKRSARSRLVIKRANSPAHDFYQLLADGKPEPGSPEAAARGSIGLKKGLEDAFTNVLFDANPGVSYRAAK